MKSIATFLLIILSVAILLMVMLSLTSYAQFTLPIPPPPIHRILWDTLAPKHDSVSPGYIACAGGHISNAITYNRKDTIQGIFTFYVEETPYLVLVHARGYMTYGSSSIRAYIYPRWRHAGVCHKRSFFLNTNKWYQFIPNGSIFQPAKFRSRTERRHRRQIDRHATVCSNM